ncbi:MAG: hypothetical protein ACRCYO_18820, partial [Bacteroidia bacterium]
MRQFFILVIVSVSALLVSCGGGNSPLRLRAVSKVTVDEQDLVIRNLPRSLHWINDSLAAMQVKNAVVVYNVHTGKIRNKYSGPKLNTDSLITQTHKRFWPSFHELIPNFTDPGNNGVLPADLLSPEEFNILNSSPGVRFLILADDTPNLD